MATCSWRCHLCGTVTTIVDKKTGRYTFSKVRGQWRPRHLKGDCPRTRRVVRRYGVGSGAASEG
jgi:hypothetical protein